MPRCISPEDGFGGRPRTVPDATAPTEDDVEVVVNSPPAPEEALREEARELRRATARRLTEAAGAAARLLEGLSWQHESQASQVLEPARLSKPVREPAPQWKLPGAPHTNGVNAKFAGKLAAPRVDHVAVAQGKSVKRCSWSNVRSRSELVTSDILEEEPLELDSEASLDIPCEETPTNHVKAEEDALSFDDEEDQDLHPFEEFDKAARAQTAWTDLMSKLLSCRSINYQLHEAWESVDVLPANFVDVTQKLWQQRNFTVLRKTASSLFPEHDPYEAMSFEDWCSYVEDKIMIHPVSLKRIAWIVCGICFMGWDLLEISLEPFGLQQDIFTFMRVVALIFWTFDIVMSFITGVVYMGKIEMSAKIVARLYVKSWFVFDVFVLITDWCFFIVGDGSSSLATKLSALRVLRYFRLVRMLKFTHLISEALDRITSMVLLVCIRMAGFVFGVLVWIHFNGCMWFAIGIRLENGWVMQRDIEFRSFWYKYLTSVHWSVCQLQGSTETFPLDSTEERGYAVLATFCSVVILAIFVSQLTTLLHSIAEMQSKKAVKMRAICAFLSQNMVSATLAMRVRECAKSAIAMELRREHCFEDQALLLLPNDLRRQVILESNTPRITPHLIFAALHAHATMLFPKVACDMFSERFYGISNHVFEHGVREGLVFVALTGRLDYFNYGNVLASCARTFRVDAAEVDNSAAAAVIFGQREHRQHGSGRGRNGEEVALGSLISEASMWVRWEHVGDLAAVSHSSLLVLDVAHYLRNVMLYPQVLQWASSHASRVVEHLNHRDTKLSDLITSDDVLAWNDFRYARRGRGYRFLPKSNSAESIRFSVSKESEGGLEGSMSRTVLNRMFAVLPRTSAR